MNTCPHCHATEHQIKAGINRGGSQRYQCQNCQHYYTLTPKPRGCAELVREGARALHHQGMNSRQIGQLLGVSHSSVANWIRQTSTSESPKSDVTPIHSASTSSIRDEALPITRRVTIRDVALRAGVSIATISNLINEKGHMSSKTEARIRAAMDELHFTPNALVRAIRTRRTHILGVLIAGISDMHTNHNRYSFATPLVSGIYKAATEAKYDVLLYTGWPDRPERESGLDFLNGHIDGLLWGLPETNQPTAIERVAAAGLPVISLMSQRVPSGVGYIHTDNIAGMEKIITHLASLGHHRIGFVSPVHSSDFSERLQGYRQALRSANLSSDPDLEITYAELRRDRQAYQQALDVLLALPKPPTAIVAASDLWACWLGDALLARGLRIPEDIAITGFDDVKASETDFGGLTTLRQPFQQIGEMAARNLIALIDGASVEDCRVQVPVSLVVRASTLGSGRVGRHQPPNS